MAHLNRELGKIPGAVGFAFPPPAIPGVGTSGGVTFVLEDRSGKGIPFLAVEPAEVHGSRAEAPGTGEGVHHRPALRAAGVMWT